MFWFEIILTETEAIFNSFWSKILSLFLLRSQLSKLHDSKIHQPRNS